MKEEREEGDRVGDGGGRGRRRGSRRIGQKDEKDRGRGKREEEEEENEDEREVCGNDFLKRSKISVRDPGEKPEKTL